MSAALPDIVDTVILPLPPERAWTLLTDEAFVPQWLGCLRYRAEVGHLFYMQQDAEKRQADEIEGATHCEVLELSPNRRFRFSWFLPGTPKTEVIFDLAGHEDGTQVSFRHSGWDQFDAEAIRQIHDALSGGWRSFVLPGLLALAESDAS